MFIVLLLSITATMALRRQAIDNLEVPSFAAGKRVAHVDCDNLTDASGLAASRIFKDVLYTHNDGNGAPYIYAINATSGALIAALEIANARNRDWEDIAVGPCGNSRCIYISDSGATHHKSSNTIYRVKEPDELNEDQVLPLDSTARYTWSQKASETIMVDPRGEVYLVSAVYKGSGMVSHLPNNSWGNPLPVNIESTQFLPIHTTHHNDPASGDISVDGSELLINARYQMFLWEIDGGDIMTSLTKPPVRVPYHRIGKNEAVCWSADGQNYYTLPEGHKPSLYIYTRINTETPDLIGNLIGK
ncbi:uncharacterized protein LOC134257348 [Saccostrea cucullata]|uniref:uncharacterized protein LOC134257348 n=1 Tax=Saccostrea cuccullata TaxID=36930 RepID=UPI002ED48961